MHKFNNVLILAILSGCADSVNADWSDEATVDTASDFGSTYEAPETPPQGVPENTVETRASISILSEPGYTTLATNEWMQVYGQSDKIMNMLDLDVCTMSEPLWFMQAEIELRGDTDGNTEQMNNNIPADQWVSGCYGWVDENLQVESDPYTGMELSYFNATLQGMTESGVTFLDLEDFDPTVDWRPLFGVKVEPWSCRTVHMSCSFKDIPVATGNPDVWSLSVKRVTVQKFDDIIEPMVQEAEIEMIEASEDGLNTKPDTWIMLF